MSAPAGIIGLTSISGDAGRLIRLGQWLNGNGFSRWEHAFVALPGGMILEAEPGGAVIRPLRYAAAGIHWCEGIYGLLAPGAGVAGVARKLEGVPYSFLDYGALALRRLHVPVPGLQSYIASTGHQICSQLCDVVYQRLGAQIYDDGRWPGYVTPGALYQRDLQLRSKT